MDTILVIDDEPAIRESLVFSLGRDGFETLEADTLAAAEALWERATLIILDLMLPDGSGSEFLRSIRQTSQVPVVILTSRGDETDRVVGLELGADDYVVKPFSPREVVARVRAVLRRATPSGPVGADDDDGTLRGPDGLQVAPAKRTACVGDARLDLSKIEFDLLVTFLHAPGRVFERGQLLDAVWGDAVVGDRTVDVHVKALRKKLEDCGADPGMIETVRGVGYRLREEETA